MKRIALIVLSGLLTFAAGFSGPVTVTGKVTGAPGGVIRLMKYSDHISYLKETLDSDTITGEGSFFLRGEIPATCLAWLDIDFQQAEIFLQPGGEYVFTISYDREEVSASYYERLGLPLEIVKDDPDRLNFYIQDFNRLYNDYMLSLADRNAGRGQGFAFETFRKAIQLRFQNAENPYLKGYIRYKSASMQLFLRLMSRDNLGTEYLAGQPVLYENVEYMDFFHLYFEKYFLAGNKYFSFNKTYDLFNGNIPYPVIIDSMAGDPALAGGELRELLLLKGLKELYSINGFKKDRIIQLVTQVNQNSEYEPLRTIAGNLLARLNWLQPGTTAPGLSFTQPYNEETISLEDFRGKFVYLAFLDSRNPACLAELQLGEELPGRYAEKVAFVAVFIDRDKDRLSEWIAGNQIPWRTFLHSGDPVELEKFDATTVPHFILLDAQGKIVRCPAPSPSEDIKKVLDAL